MKQYKILAASLVLLFSASAYGAAAAPNQEKLLELLPEQSRPLSALKGFDALYKPAFFDRHIVGGRKRIRNVKSYLNFITIMLDTVKDSTPADLPKIGNADLKKQTQQALEEWNLSLNKVGDVWFIQSAGPKTFEEAVNQTTAAAQTANKALSGATAAQKGYANNQLKAALEAIVKTVSE